jgi:hypothetical protein
MSSRLKLSFNSQITSTGGVVLAQTDEIAAADLAFDEVTCLLRGF